MVRDDTYLGNLFVKWAAYEIIFGHNNGAELGSILAAGDTVFA